jgi:hypothetical protein
LPVDEKYCVLSIPGQNPVAVAEGAVDVCVVVAGSTKLDAAEDVVDVAETLDIAGGL